MFSKAVLLLMRQNEYLWSKGLKRGVVSEWWSLKTGDCLIQVASDTGLTVYYMADVSLSKLHLVQAPLAQWVAYLMRIGGGWFNLRFSQFSLLGLMMVI